MDSEIDIALQKIGRSNEVVKGKITSRISAGTMGGTEQKYRDDVEIGGKKIKLIERHPIPDSVPPEGRNDPLGFTIRGIKILQDSGIPTPVSYEGDFSGRPVLLSENVTADGSTVYGKSAYSRLVSEGPEPADKVFMKLLDEKIHQVFGKDDTSPPEGSLWWWLISANTAGVVLPADDAMELVVKPDGSFTWMVLDPVGTRTDSELNITKLDVVDRNLKSVEAAFEDVYGVYKQLKQRESPEDSESRRPPMLDI